MVVLKVEYLQIARHPPTALFSSSHSLPFSLFTSSHSHLPYLSHVPTSHPPPQSALSHPISRIPPPRSRSHPFRAPDLATHALGLSFPGSDADVRHRTLHVSIAQHRLLPHHAQGRGIGQYVEPKRRVEEGDGGLILVSGNAEGRNISSWELGP